MKLTVVALVISACFYSGSLSNFGLDADVLTEKTGDLDKDGIAEKVEVLNTKNVTDEGIEREIQILKLKDGKWSVWQKSRNAVMKSEQGGMMGEPFESITVEKGILTINHAGGSSWKWSKQDKYRFQNNEFQLIGHTGSYGKLCEYWVEVDFNISTGKILYKKDFEDCENDQGIYKTEQETFYKKGFSINLANRNLKEIKLISPKYKAEFYL